MNKIISFILLCALLLLCFSGCSNPSGVIEESPSESQTGAETPPDDSFAGTVLDKNSDLVTTLTAYLKQYFTSYELAPKSFAQKIDDIKNGIQPLHVAFNPSDYYFVCGYYNSSVSYEFERCDEYTWVEYKDETEIKEYCNGMRWNVIFQINKALTVTDIVSNERQIPDIEHFQIIKPTFENGVNITAPVVFDETFIYLNYPNCYLNRSSQDASRMYYCKSIYYHSTNTIPCVCLDGEYYLYFYWDTVYADGSRSEEADYTYHFGKYYDALMSIMDKDKYSVKREDGYTDFYGTISFDAFINDILK